MTTKKPMIGWKKACWFDTKSRVFRFVIVKLEIRGRTVMDGFGYNGYVVYKTNKCRTSLAKVLKIYSKTKQPIISWFRGQKTQYITGQLVRPDSPFDTRQVACASGIHFFRTRKEAEKYRFT